MTILNPSFSPILSVCFIFALSWTHVSFAITLKEHWARGISENHMPPLPAAAAGPIFHIDPDLLFEKSFVSFDASHDNIFESLQRHTTAAHQIAASGDKSTELPYVLCGPQTYAKEARSLLTQVTGRIRHQVAYNSRHDDVACWHVALRETAVTQVEASSFFFHVSPVPEIAKFAPGLFILTNKQKEQGPVLHVSELFFTQGIRVHLTDSHSHSDGRAKMIQDWSIEGFGLSGSHAHAFFSMSDHGTAAWKAAHASALEADCARNFKASVTESSSFLHLLLHRQPSLARGGIRGLERQSSTLNVCGILTLAFLSHQPQVRFIETAAPKQIHSGPRISKTLLLPTLRRTDLAAVTALQSGDPLNPTPFFDVGVNGTGQYVHVSDTGFDDASCFLREANSKNFLTGTFNSDFQIERSLASAPFTNKSQRKIVQYITVSTVSGSSFEYDCYNCEGTHTSTTIAGSIDSGDSSIVQMGDVSSTCASSGQLFVTCSNIFCSSCNQAGDCDGSCGLDSIDDNDDYSGVAPNAKLMVVDFGNSVGSITVPADYETDLFGPAYDEGARISSNSWGGGSYYSSDSVQVDNIIYNLDDFLVIFSAGDEGTGGGVSEPGTAKNCLTVGAAVTASTPNTVASFSSRGPTRDLRMKPEVVAPGDAVYSAMASGNIGLQSCQITPSSGTALAAAGVAGAAALLRDFLVNNRSDSSHAIFSPAGFASSKYNSRNPSSALIKAMLIASSTPMTFGYNSSENQIKLSDFYGGTAAFSDMISTVVTEKFQLGTAGFDYAQGFGHVRITNILPVDKSFELFLFEDALDEYSTLQMTFIVSNVASNVKVALVWTDPPSFEYCDYFGAGACLVSDLDLQVVHKGNRVYSNLGASFNGTFSGQEDEINNVELVSINASVLTIGDTLTVGAATNGLSYADSQKFALVVTGGLAIVPGSTRTVSSMTPTMTPTLCLRAKDAVSLESGGCTVSNDNLCIFSPNYPNLYGTDEHCVFNVQSGGYIEVESFDTGFDVVEIRKSGALNFSSFSGTEGPSRVEVSDSDKIVFKSNGVTTASGFHMCVAIPTCQPTSTPTISTLPTSSPIPMPTTKPTPAPTPSPTFDPTIIPSPIPTFSLLPTLAPTPLPSPVPTSAPTFAPTINSTKAPLPKSTRPPLPAVKNPETAGTCGSTCLLSIACGLTVVVIASLILYWKGHCKDESIEPKSAVNDESDDTGALPKLGGEKKLTKLQELLKEETAVKKKKVERKLRKKNRNKNPYRTKSLERIHNIFDDLQKLRKGAGKDGLDVVEDDEIDCFGDEDLRGVSMIRNDDAVHDENLLRTTSPVQSPPSGGSYSKSRHKEEPLLEKGMSSPQTNPNDSIVDEDVSIKSPSAGSHAHRVRHVSREKGTVDDLDDNDIYNIGFADPGSPFSTRSRTRGSPTSSSSKVPSKSPSHNVMHRQSAEATADSKQHKGANRPKKADKAVPNEGIFDLPSILDTFDVPWGFAQPKEQPKAKSPKKAAKGTLQSSPGTTL